MRRVFILLLAVSAFLTGVMFCSIRSSSAAEIARIRPEELKQLIDSHDPGILVVDVQPKAAYDLGHIKGAVNFPWALDIRSPSPLPKDRTLILYCDCGHEEDPNDVIGLPADNPAVCAATDDSVDVAEQLITKFGYKNVMVLQGGWFRWQELGYPVEKKQ